MEMRSTSALKDVLQYSCAFLSWRGRQQLGHSQKDRVHIEPCCARRAARAGRRGRSFKEWLRTTSPQ
eukprot:213341-Amphidinium_carterae.1